MSNIKMRVNKDENAICTCCGKGRNISLDMYDIKIKQMVGSIVLTICDNCNEELLRKSLKASCITSERTKSTKDINVIKLRNRKRNGYDK